MKIDYYYKTPANIRDKNIRNLNSFIADKIYDLEKFNNCVSYSCTILLNNKEEKNYESY